MPSFDVVCEIDLNEVRNAVDQANREIDTRFDFKGSDSRVELSDHTVTIYTEDDFKAGQVMEILNNKLVKRKIDLKFLDAQPVKAAGGDRVTQEIKLFNGIDQPLARELIKTIKSSKIKVQTAIQGDQLRISGKKRDDLQQTIALLKESAADRPLQYVNFRD
jgi:cyclic-di-GMP-binding protein